MTRATCKICDGPLPPRRRKICGDAECLRVDKHRRTIASTKRWEERNGRSHHSRYREQRNEAKRAYGWRARFPEKAARYDAERRARLVGATVGEPFTNREIYERDGWICGICDGPIDQEARFPDPASASLDHIHPLSKGGAHSRENAQASHLGCNVSKNDRVA